MKINNYEAPSVKLYEVRLCGMLNASANGSKGPEDMDTSHTASEWGGWV